jgi:hypothetical protein
LNDKTESMTIREKLVYRIVMAQIKHGSMNPDPDTDDESNEDDDDDDDAESIQNMAEARADSERRLRENEDGDSFWDWLSWFKRQLFGR